MDGNRGFQIHGLNGYILSIGIGGGHYCENYARQWHTNHATSTMEVAVMRDDAKQGHNAFVALVHDVAGYVPASNLSALIDAVERHDWERVCRLCGEESPNPDQYADLPCPAEAKKIDDIVEDYAEELREQGQDVETMIVSQEDVKNFIKDEEQGG